MHTHCTFHAFYGKIDEPYAHLIPITNHTYTFSHNRFNCFASIWDDLRFIFSCTIVRWSEQRKVKFINANTIQNVILLGTLSNDKTARSFCIVIYFTAVEVELELVISDKSGIEIETGNDYNVSEKGN